MPYMPPTKFQLESGKRPYFAINQYGNKVVDAKTNKTVLTGMFIGLEDADNNGKPDTIVFKGGNDDIHAFNTKTGKHDYRGKVTDLSNALKKSTKPNR